jgi:hypothetical protein
MNNPTRTYRALIVKRMTDEYESLAADSAVYLSTAFTSWRLNLDRASSLDYLLVWRHGKVIDVASVYGAEPIATRHGGLGDRVRLIAGAIAPKAEPLIGTEVEMSNRNPVAYADIVEDLLTGEISLHVSA